MNEYSATPITDALDDQNSDGVIQPGTPGWWQVWGASVQDILPGDMVMVKWSQRVSPEDDGIAEYVVEARLDDGNGIAPLFQVQDGKVRLGVLQPVQVLRWGTKNTLSPHCR